MFNISRNILIISLFFFNIFSKNSYLDKSYELTIQEAACLEWFEEMKTELDWGFKNLSEEDKDVFRHGLSYSDDSNLIKRVIKNFATDFWNYALNKNIIMQFDKDILVNSMLKYKDFIAVRMFMCSQLLTPQEHISIEKDNFFRKPEDAVQTISRCGKLYAQELARLNLIPNNEETKEYIAKEFARKKMSELKKKFKFNS